MEGYQYTPATQKRILALFWRDDEAYFMYQNIIKPHYFTVPMYVDICRLIKDYRDKYLCMPTLVALLEEVNLMCSKSKVKQKLLEDYENNVKELVDEELGNDTEYLRDLMRSFGKQQAVIEAVLSCADIIGKETITPKTGARIEHMMRDALTVGDEVKDLGTDFFENTEARLWSYTTEPDVIERIPTGMGEFDRALNGGLGRTEMGVVVAPPGKGKTTFLISAAGAGVRAGYKVFHISFENNKKQILRNYDVRLLEKSMSYIIDLDEEGNRISELSEVLQNIQKYRKGGLMVKKWPPKTKTVLDIRALLDQLRVVYNFVPDVLVVDYGALLKPITSKKSEKRFDMESNYEELRAIADDYNLALWTAAQGTRGALSKETVTMADLAECFAIGNIADVMPCMSQTLKEKSKNKIRLFLAKIRDTADGLLLGGTIDYGIKKLYFDEIVEQDETTGDTSSRKYKKKKKDTSEEDENEDDAGWEE